MRVNYKNQEGYQDQTAFEALSQIDKEARKYRPLVYICSPYSGDIELNTKKAQFFSRFAVDQGAIPLTPHLLLPQFMKEESERELAMFIDMVFLSKCEQVWVFGGVISEGMKTEIEKAKKKQMPIRYFTDELKEEP